MVVFWREKPLDDVEMALLRALSRAHASAVFRQNPSSVAVQLAAQGSGELTKALVAALSTLGGKHGPLEQTAKLLACDDPAKKAEEVLDRGEQVCGWGSSFPLPDAEWSEVQILLEKNCPEIWEKVCSVTEALHRRGKSVLPNPSCFTASVCLALALPPALCPLLFVQARLPGWAQLFMEATSR